MSAAACDPSPPRPFARCRRCRTKSKRNLFDSTTNKRLWYEKCHEPPPPQQKPCWVVKTCLFGTLLTCHRDKLNICHVAPRIQGKANHPKNTRPIKTVCTNRLRKLFLFVFFLFNGKRRGTVVQVVPKLFAQIVLSFAWVVFIGRVSPA